MGMIEVRALGAAAFFLVILLSGVWLSRRGRPFSALIMTVHKLLGLGAGIFLVVTLVQLERAAGLGAGVIAAAVVTGLALLGAAATGAMLSGAKPAPALLLRLHQAAALLAPVGAAVLFCLLLYLE